MRSNSERDLNANSGGKIVLWVFALLIVGLGLAVVFVKPEDERLREQIEQRMVKDAQKIQVQPLDASPSKWADMLNSVPFGNGNTWNSYPEGVKLDLANRVAAASSKGNSAQFYIDGLNTMYNPNDSSTLDMSLSDAIQLLESGSSALTQKDRSY